MLNNIEKLSHHGDGHTQTGSGDTAKFLRSEKEEDIPTDN